MENLVVISEGRVKLKVPDPSKYLRLNGVYEPAWAPVFYNPQMTMNRDLSVIALVTIFKSTSLTSSPVVLDALAGTGVRAIRYCVEVPATSLCLANDVDPRAVKLIEENSVLNNVQDRVKVFHEDANILMYRLKKERQKVDFIDVDPFGSPAPYVRASLWCVRRGGVVAYTATDTAPLSGSRWRAGSRKYDVSIIKTDIGHEVGLRVLIGYIARRAAEIDRYVAPLLSYFDRYYYRVFVRVAKGAGKANNMIRQDIGYLKYCPNCGYRSLIREIDNLTCPNCGGRLHLIGPMWVSSLADNVFVSDMLSNLESRQYHYLQTARNARKLLQVLLHEVDLPLVYNIVKLSQMLKVDMPKRDDLIKCLRELGYKAVKTHLHGGLIRTNAGVKDITYCLRSLTSLRN